MTDCIKNLYVKSTYLKIVQNRMVRMVKGQLHTWSLVTEEIPKKMNTIISIKWASILIMYFSVSLEP